MSVINKCNAPDSFIKAIDQEIPKILRFSESMGVEVYRFSIPNVIVVDKRNDQTSPFFTDIPYLLDILGTNISKMKNILGAMPYQIGIDWDRLDYLLRQLMEALPNEERGCENPGEQINEIIKEILEIIKEIKKECLKEGISIPEIISDIEDIMDKIIWREYPITLLGCFDKPDIYLCYETIIRQVGIAQPEELGRAVLAHEMFHAIHYSSMINFKKWDGNTQQTHVRRRAVLESLAEYFSMRYSERYLSQDVQIYAEKKNRCHPFPNWGYAGSQLFYDYLNSRAVHTIQSEALFKNVFYLSLFNMEEGYRFLKEMKGRLEENKKYGQPLY